MKKNQTILLIAFLLMHACATTEQAEEKDEEDERLESTLTSVDYLELPEDFYTAYLDELDISGLSDFDALDLSEEEARLYFSRSSLSDRFDTDTHDMPDFYLQEIEEEEIDINQGFRIQILSTRNINLADSTLAEFETWADSTFTTYNPYGYVHYRQPYYRVRIGDFHNRDRAVEFSRLIKNRYPEAWIIHDQVNPYRVPADTLDFFQQKQEVREEEQELPREMSASDTSGQPVIILSTRSGYYATGFSKKLLR